MELILNTQNKTIVLKGRVNIVELYDTLHELGIDFSEWTIEGETIYTTITIPETKPYNPWTDPWIQPYQPYQPQPWTTGDRPLPNPLVTWCHAYNM